ncbi:MAG TPA: hypothetical protein VFE47_07835 [Tepidisphaeraceae bacterium]|jgi:hypothetical protein|nr:hypothetical protein [Tepidisphaeraceae bacterium]
MPAAVAGMEFPIIRGMIKACMMNLQLYQSYTSEQIFADFGNPQPTEAEGWFVSSNRLLGLFAIGERPLHVDSQTRSAVRQ